MAFFKFITTSTIFQLGFFSKLRNLFGFGSKNLPITAAAARAPEVKPIATPKSSSPSFSAPLPPPPVKEQRRATMNTSAVHMAAAARKPLIKFVGARMPRPVFDRASLPPLQVSGNAVAPLSTPKATSIGPVGKIPRGQGVAENQLPMRFRRPLIDQEEIDAINNGGTY